MLVWGISCATTPAGTCSLDKLQMCGVFWVEFCFPLSDWDQGKKLMFSSPCNSSTFILPSSVFLENRKFLFSARNTDIPLGIFYIGISQGKVCTQVLELWKWPCSCLWCFISENSMTWVPTALNSSFSFTLKVVDFAASRIFSRKSFVIINYP